MSYYFDNKNRFWGRDIEFGDIFLEEKLCNKK